MLCHPRSICFPARPVNADRENPFDPARLAHLPFRFPPGTTWETLMAKLAAQNYCAAIVGPLGGGKTSLLEQLSSRIEALGFEPKLFRIASETGMKEKERLVEELRRIVKPGFILLDGAEQLSTRQWLPVRGAASKAAGFVITLHRVSRLPILFECEPRPPLFEAIVHELTGAWLQAGEAQLLLARHHGNVRAALGELHDRWDGA